MATDKCEVCGITWDLWLACEEPCETSECHDWEDSMDDDGEYIVSEGQRAYKVGGFITYD
jgi:hypothetical protein